MVADIIPFPNKRIKRNPPVDPKKATEQLSIEYVNSLREMSVTLCNALTEKLNALGYHVNDNTIRDMCLVSEAIMSYVCKCRGIEHPLQIFSECSFDELDSGGFMFKTKNFAALDKISALINIKGLLSSEDISEEEKLEKIKQIVNTSLGFMKPKDNTPDDTNRPE